MSSSSRRTVEGVQKFLLLGAEGAARVFFLREEAHAGGGGGACTPSNPARRAPGSRRRSQTSDLAERRAPAANVAERWTPYSAKRAGSGRRTAKANLLRHWEAAPGARGRACRMLSLAAPVSNLNSLLCGCSRGGARADASAMAIWDLGAPARRAKSPHGLCYSIQNAAPNSRASCAKRPTKTRAPMACSR